MALAFASEDSTRLVTSQSYAAGRAHPKLVLDVMPIASEILGFSNPWYEKAISAAAPITLDSGAEIRAATPASLMATKLCAWKDRGKGDLLRSLDVHDVLILIDGRRDLVSEIEAAEPDLRGYVRDELAQLQTELYFDHAVDGATAGYGPLGADRANLVRERLHQCVLRC